MSSKISEQKKRRITFGIPAPVSTSSFTSNREEQKAHQRDVLEALGLPDSLNEFLASLDSKNIEELASLSDQPLSDAQVEAFRAAYRHERKAKLVRPQPSSSGTERAASEQDNTAWSNDEEEDFQSFLSLLTDSRKFSVCLRGDPPGESDLLFSRTLNKILHVEGIPSSVQGEIMRYYHRKSLGHLLRAVRNEDKQTQVITYYAKGAHLVGLQSRQLMKYILQDGFENKKSPYSKRPSLNTNYRPPWKCMTPVKLQNIKSTKTHRTVELEDRIRQLTVKREGKQTLEMVTALKIKVPLKVKNREKVTYDDINQIRRKTQAGLNSYLRTLTHCKRWDMLQSWRSLHNFYAPLSHCTSFPETFSTYSWSWSGRRNLVEIWELVKDQKAAAHPPPPTSSAPPTFTRPSPTSSAPPTFTRPSPTSSAPPTFT